MCSVFCRVSRSRIDVPLLVGFLCSRPFRCFVTRSASTSVGLLLDPKAKPPRVTTTLATWQNAHHLLIRLDQPGRRHV
jgi:hypothetical protein